MQILENISRVLGEEAPTEDMEIRKFVRKAARVSDEIFSKYMPQTQDYMDVVKTAILAKKGLPLPPVIEEEQVESGYEDKSEDEVAVPVGVVSATTYPVYTVDYLLHEREQGKIRLPVFQRDFVWDTKKQSAFIDAILKGVPMVTLMLAAESIGESKQLLDGFQRISTIERFRVGKLKTGNRVEGFENRKFDALPVELQNRLLNTQFPISDVIGPKENWSFIFSMVNKGGAPLNAMELRRCIFPYAFVQMLEEITQNHQTWKTIFGARKRYLGLQSLLRAYSLHSSYKVYTPTMASFLDLYCETLSHSTKDELRTQRNRLDIIFEMMHDGISPEVLYLKADKKQVNLGLLDVLFHAANMLLDAAGTNFSINELGKQLREVRTKFFESAVLLNSLQVSTSSREAVNTRMTGIEQIVEEVLNTYKPAVAGGKRKG